MTGSRRVLAALAVIGLVATACGTGASPTPGPATIRLQLQWVPQAQFAGEFAALELGYYTAENLKVELVPGGPNVANVTVSAISQGLCFGFQVSDMAQPRYLTFTDGTTDIPGARWS